MQLLFTWHLITAGEINDLPTGSADAAAAQPHSIGAQTAVRCGAGAQSLLLGHVYLGTVFLVRAQTDAVMLCAVTKAMLKANAARLGHLKASQIATPAVCSCRSRKWRPGTRWAACKWPWRLCRNACAPLTAPSSNFAVMRRASCPSAPLGYLARQERMAPPEACRRPSQLQKVI